MEWGGSWLKLKGDRKRRGNLFCCFLWSMAFLRWISFFVRSCTPVRLFFIVLRFRRPFLRTNDSHQRRRNAANIPERKSSAPATFSLRCPIQWRSLFFPKRACVRSYQFSNPAPRQRQPKHQQQQKKKPPLPLLLLPPRKKPIVHKRWGQRAAKTSTWGGEGGDRKGNFCSLRSLLCLSLILRILPYRRRRFPAPF